MARTPSQSIETIVRNEYNKRESSLKPLSKTPSLLEFNEKTPKNDVIVYINQDYAKLI
jgi:hypothetical protein